GRCLRVTSLDNTCQVMLAASSKWDITIYRRGLVIAVLLVNAGGIAIAILSDHSRNAGVAAQTSYVGLNDSGSVVIAPVMDVSLGTVAAINLLNARCVSIP